MKNWKLLLSLALILAFATPVVFAADDCYEPIRNAKEVKAYGPALSGATPYGTMSVITRNDECYEYLTHKGQYIKYRKCGDDQWIEIEHNFIER